MDKNNFENLTFDKFKILAKDDSLSCYEKIGFPDSYRKDHEKNIWQDILKKLPSLSEKGKVVLDIGCGCSNLVHMLIEKCVEKKHKLILCDSEEMLALLPDKDIIEKIAGRFPNKKLTGKKIKGMNLERESRIPPCDSDSRITHITEKRIDVIIIYSVLQHVFLEQNIFSFIDHAVSLLNDGGHLLLGDIPNVSKRKRFFSSPEGIAYHQKFTNTKDIPSVDFMAKEPDKIDDSIIMNICSRYRNFGFETYVLPQSKDMPMYGRREDVLIVN